MPRPLVLISPNAYKGTLSPSRAASLILLALKKYSSRYQFFTLPLADGGDGTLDVGLSVFHGRRRTTTVAGPRGRPVRAEWALIDKRIALIEMARASGLALVKGRNRILDATSFGTGQLIRAALDAGCREIWIGVGGTATGDGGAGALRALGFNLLDRKRRSLSGSPRSLLKLASVDRSALDVRLRRCRISVLCDVDNPLLGPRGSARIFGPQKGATSAQVPVLERALSRWSRFAVKQTRNRPGAGAAGALAYGLSAFAGARLVRGTTFLMKATGWRQYAAHASIIITGEGKLDRTSFYGKAVGEILRHKGRARVVVLTGRCEIPAREWKKRGIWRVVEMGKDGLKNPSPSLRKAAREAWKNL